MAFITPPVVHNMAYFKQGLQLDKFIEKPKPKLIPAFKLIRKTENRQWPKPTEL